MVKFDSMEEVLVDGLRGGKGIARTKAFADDKAKMMMLTLDKGVSVGLHTHDTSCEIQYVVSGEAHFTLDGKEEIVKKGECHYCPKGHAHTVINDHDEPLVMFCAIPNQ